MRSWSGQTGLDAGLMDDKYEGTVEGRMDGYAIDLGETEVDGCKLSWSDGTCEIVGLSVDLDDGERWKKGRRR